LTYTYVELFGGLIWLLLAGDLLVRGALALAGHARIPPMIVGLTVVAFGTSAPELCVSLGAAFKGHPTIAIGNVVGSNIANVLLVLGLPALIHPTLCHQDSLWRDTLVLIAVSVLFTAFCFQGSLGPLQGTVLVVGLLTMLLLSLREARHSGGETGPCQELERVLGLPRSPGMIVLFLVLGGVGLPLGADLLVGGAVELAESLGVPSAVIGLSLIALGTSLPELFTTLIAAVHRSSDVALGNVLGSNLFNILAIMGATAMVAPAPIPVPESFLRFDLLVMLGASGLLAWFAWRRGSIGRSWGTALLAAYALYLVVLFRSPHEVAAIGF
jgi:cation:H+ antiporter